MTPSSIAVLGGGITGLSAAFHLSRRFPSSRILILEKSKRLGGWIQSKKVQISLPGGDVGTAVLELGPRTLRPQSLALLELVHLLHLDSQVITTSTKSDAAKNRFLYIPDKGRSGLTRIPTGAWSLLFSPLAKTIVPSVFREGWRRANRTLADDEDESFDSILTRRFGPELARVLGSSLTHGVYAADSRKLSVNAALPIVRKAEAMGDGSIVKGLIRMRKSEQSLDKTLYETGELESIMHDVSVYSFKNGLETLPQALRQNLENNSNVEIRTSTEVVDISPKNKSFEIAIPNDVITTSHVVSTLPLPVLSSFPSTANLPHLTANPTSSVIVVTFVFPMPASQIHPSGFGYLIPRPKTGYDSDVNREGVLGVVFDSCSVGQQDMPLGEMTKMTMMLGGPYTPQLPPVEDKQLFAQMVFETLQRHLGRRIPTPAYVEITQQRNCIPRPTPGHFTRLAELAAALEDSPWNGRFEVAGAGVGGVSLGDCVKQGRNAGGTWGE